MLTVDREWSEYPAGTKAHAFNGGAWLKLASGGWQWNGHTQAPGSTFPTPGADAIGACVELPACPEPACTECGAPITTGAMAMICPHGRACEFVEDDEHWLTVEELREELGMTRYTLRADAPPAEQAQGGEQA